MISRGKENKVLSNFNPHGIRNIKWLLIAWTTYIITFILQILILGGYQEKEPNKLVWTNIIAGYIVGILLILFFIIPLNRFINKFKISKKIIILIGGAFLFSLIFIVLTTFIQAILMENHSVVWFTDQINWYLHFNLHNVLKNYIFLTVLLFALTYFQRESELIKRETSLRNRLVQVQLSNLKSQFQPHFLFNALNSIVAVVEESGDRAQLMLIQLSDILRETMDSRYDCEQSLEKEVEFLSKYLSVEKLRYEDQLNYRFIIEPLSNNIKIPCLILQPMVENAIKHGFKRNIKSLEILIIAEQKSIFVKNNGSKLIRANYGQGLKGVEDRLRIMYDNKVSFKIYQEGEFVVNELKFQ